jgi:dihydroceramide fatty acyl 2-hydroxylase
MNWLTAAAAGACGFLAWGGVEYLVHGVLSHRFRTFVTPLHGAHHSDPRAVFTAPIAVVPSAVLLYGIAAIAAGPALGAVFIAGILVGFARYELVHWRIHFRVPRNDRERRLRDHHLAHHFANPRAYHGVTTQRFDRWFGTLPDSWERDYARVTGRAPLVGRSNLADVWNPRTALAIWRRSRGETADQ